VRRHPTATGLPRIKQAVALASFDWKDKKRGTTSIEERRDCALPRTKPAAASKVETLHMEPPPKENVLGLSAYKDKSVRSIVVQCSARLIIRKIHKFLIALPPLTDDVPIILVQDSKIFNSFRSGQFSGSIEHML
jgi:hypothetical protein